MSSGEREPDDFDAEWRFYDGTFEAAMIRLRCAAADLKRNTDLYAEQLLKWVDPDV